MPGKERRLPNAPGEPRKLPPGARRSTASVDLSEHAEVTLVVRLSRSDDEWYELIAKLTSGLPGERRYLSRAEVLRKWSASPEAMETVRKYATAQRLKVVSSDPLRRCVVVSGSLQQLGRAFDIHFYAVDHPLGRFRSHDGIPRIHPLVE